MYPPKCDVMSRWPVVHNVFALEANIKSLSLFLAEILQKLYILT